MSKFIMKIVCYFKKHFVTRIRSFVFTYRKSAKRKCPVTIIEVGIGQKFVNRLIGHFFSTINRLIVENMLHNGNNKIYQY